MGLWFGRKYAGLPTEREAELWKLVDSLQREKEAIRAELDRWRESYLALTGLGNQTVPAQHAEPTVEVDKGVNVLGRHVSLIGLRHKYEQKSREEAAKRKVKDDAS